MKINKKIRGYNLNLIEYVKASEKYAKSYCKTLDKVARERKYLATTKGFSEENILDFVKMIEKNNLSQFYALKDDRVIGWCDIIPKNFEGLNHVGVLGLGILPEFRNQGIGTNLLKLAEKHAKKNNKIEKVELEVFKSNKNAIKLFEKQGFKKEGERIKSRKLDGIYDNIVLMGKQI